MRWLVVLLSACAVSPVEVDSVTQPATAHCRTTVVELNDAGEVISSVELDVESEYLPRVVNCENGGAAFEALKAQAVAARSYLYYRLRTGDGTIRDGTSDQVYGCSREPREEHFDAVRETAGVVLEYMGQVPAGFYVAGSRQEPPECRGGDDDPTDTERFVTYNEGRSGDDIEQTSLGFVSPRNYANRGCLSQNGSHCLASSGWTYRDILRFYYGEDIEIVTAEGIDACAGRPPIDAGPAPVDAGVEDDAGTRDAAVAAPAEDAGIADGGASVAVRTPDGTVTTPLSSGGCSATSSPRSLAPPLVLLLLLARWRAAPSRAGRRRARGRTSS